jgi:hypothetical protein
MIFVSPSRVRSCFKLRTLKCLNGKESDKNHFYNTSELLC